MGCLRRLLSIMLVLIMLLIAVSILVLIFITVVWVAFVGDMPPFSDWFMGMGNTIREFAPW